MIAGESLQLCSGENLFFNVPDNILDGSYGSETRCLRSYFVLSIKIAPITLLNLLRPEIVDY
jgi:hypothetical protein